MKIKLKKSMVLMVVLGVLVNSITFVANVAPVAAANKIPVIIDMDMSGDIDDLGDITVLNALANLDEVEIIAVIGTSGNTASSLLGALVGEYHGNSYPAGWIADGSGTYGPGGYPAELVSQFGYSGQNADGVALYKSVLAAQPDSSVVIVTTGGLEGIHQLMINGGMGLIQQKVKMLVCAGGQYPSGGEYNFGCWAQGAEYVVNNWPVEAYFSDYRWGHDARTGNDIFINNQLAPDSRADNPTIAGYSKYIPIETNGVSGYWSGSYPTWAQVAVLYAARYDSGARQMYARNETGYNFVYPNGVNEWRTDRDPGGRQNQGYLIPRARWEVQDTLDTLFKNSNNPKSKGTRTVPNKPTDVRATVSGGNVTLTWMDNSWNENYFQIDYFNPTTGSWTSAGTAPANTKTFSHSPVTTAGAAYRVSAVNSYGNSKYAYRQVSPGGWAVLSGSDPYVHYQDGSLYWPRDTEVGVNQHMLVNNDIITGNVFTADMKISTKDNYGEAHFYFLVQDQNNWYRIKAVTEQSGRPSGVWPPTKVQPSRLEKCVNGVITQIGPNLDLWNGSEIETWKIVVNGNNIKFYWNNNYRENNGGWWGANPLPEPVLALNVNENLQWQSGKIGIGGSAYNGSGYPCKPEWGEIVVTGTTEVPSPTPTPTLAPSSPPTPTPTPTPSSGVIIRQPKTGELLGTIIGTDEQIYGTNVKEKSWDGDTTTYHESTASGAWTGTALNAPSRVSRIRFFPRSGFEGRMNGGKFQGANTPDFANAVTLYTIPTTPSAGWNEVTVSDSGSYQYLRYLTAPGGYVNACEVEFYNDGGGGEPSPIPSPLPSPSSGPNTKLTGTVIGTTSGVYGGHVIDYAYDGNTSTYVDNTTTNGWAGLDLGTAHQITSIRYYPRSDWTARMVGGKFQGSNTADFSSGVVDLYTIPSDPPLSWNEVTVSNTNTFRYVRYLTPTNGYLNVSEIEFYSGSGGGTPSPSPSGESLLSGILFGTSPAYQVGHEYDKAFDGSTSTYVDTLSGTGYTGIDLGAGNAAVVTKIRFYPVSAFASRMIGGKFQGSNTSLDSGYVDLYTIPSAPTANAWTEVTINNGTAYRYIRYLCPANGYTNVAEIEFYTE